MFGYVQLSPLTLTFFVLVSDIYDCGFSQKYDVYLYLRVREATCMAGTYILADLIYDMIRQG